MIDAIAIVLMFLFLGSLIYYVRRSLFTLVLLVAAFPLFAQNCDKTVVDGAGLIGNTAQVEQAANALIAQGADVRVVTLPSAGGNLDLAENTIEKTCPSWQGANGQRKSTLLVLMASKTDRKIGVYYGAAWRKAFDDHWNRIKTDYMVPRFKDGNFTGGFVAAEEQLTKRIIASKDESLKPNVSTTVNQATDYSGLWTAMKWFFLILAAGFGIFIIWQVFLTFERKKQAIVATQQKAIDFRNTVASGIRTIEDNISLKESAGIAVPQEAKNNVQNASEAYARLSGNLNTDPDTDGLTAAQYESIGLQYARISDQLLAAANVLRGKTTDTPNTPLSTPTVTYTPPPAPPTQQPGPAPVEERPSYSMGHDTSVVIINDSPRYEPPVYRAPEPEPEPVRESSSWSGGGSSSWGSDSSSSDSDSGGGSSSYDSGSSDSGGGGSSDY